MSSFLCLSEITSAFLIVSIIINFELSYFNYKVIWFEVEDSIYAPKALSNAERKFNFCI